MSSVASPPIPASTGTPKSPSASLQHPNPEGTLSGITIFLGAFLLFQIQPMIAKMILPWFGGSDVVWTSCMLFFQFVLLAGYAYAHWLSAQTRRTTLFLHLALLAVSLLLLPVNPGSAWKPASDANPLPRILGLLSASVGVPYFLLSSTSPLVQAWYARRSSGTVPYRLFALSNFASLLALLSYPVLIEPWIPARTQGLLWSCEYATFVLLIGWLAWRTAGPVIASPAITALRDAVSHSASPTISSTVSPTWPQRALWMILPAAASFMLLATTNHLCQNIAVVPFLWIVPLSVYLLSFILCFDHPRWYRRQWMLPLFAVGLALVGYLPIKEVPGFQVLPHIAAYIGGLFLICMFCHGELALRKPAAAHLTQFYLMISFGGAIGSALVALAAPYYLHGVYEFSIGLAACGMLVLMLEYRKFWLTDIIWTSLAVYLFVLAGLEIKATAADVRLSVRSFYGSLRVKDSMDPATHQMQRWLIHGIVSHGAQVLDPAFRHQPTMYYAKRGGVGQALNSLHAAPATVGVIGLGAGTLAAYGRPGDDYWFYELDPLVIHVAQNEFTFLSDSEAKVHVIAGDGRLMLERAHDRHFDLLAVDAFSGDSIPVHLLSREAFALYFDHLNPGGILAMHVSNSFLDLAPVVGRAAQALGKVARVVEAQEDPKEFAAHSVWILLADRAQTLDRFLPPGTTQPVPTPSNLRVWTDDYSNLFQILK